MSGFRIGDRVVIKEYSYYLAFYSLFVNTEYTILNITEKKYKPNSIYNLTLNNNIDNTITIDSKYFKLSPTYTRNKTIDEILN